MADSRRNKGDNTSPKKDRTPSELRTLSDSTLERELEIAEKTPPELFASHFNSSNPIHSITEPGRNVTICICGTASNQKDGENLDRYVIGNTISKIYDLVEGQPLIDKIIVDGAGSGGRTDNLWIPFQDYHAARGIISGAGIQERNQHILAVLKNEPKRPLSELTETDRNTHEQLKTINQERPIKQVVMDCWSRGAAVAAMELAWEMYKDNDLKNIQIVMIAHDPVTGSGQSKYEHRTIPPNVKFYYVSIAIHEASFSFHGCLPEPENPQKTTMIILEQFGGHAQGVGDENDHAGQGIPEANTRDVPVLYRFYDQLILQCHGVQLKSQEAFHIRITDTFNFYESIKKNEKAYETIATRVSYVISQLMGNERKMTDGDAYFTNQYVSDVLKRRGVEHDKKYVDSFHQMFVEFSKKAANCANIFEEHLTKLLAVEKTIYTEDSQRSMEDIKTAWQTLIKETKENELPYLYRMISEEITGRYRPQDFTQLGKRFYAEETLHQYVADVIGEKVGEHNKKIEEQKLLTEKARRAEEARKKHEEEVQSKIDFEVKLEVNLEVVIPGAVKKREAQLSRELQALNLSITTNNQQDNQIGVLHASDDNNQLRIEIKNKLNQYQSLLTYYIQNYPSHIKEENFQHFSNYYVETKKKLEGFGLNLNVLNKLNKQLNEELEKFKIYLAAFYREESLHIQSVSQKITALSAQSTKMKDSLIIDDNKKRNYDLFKQLCVLDPHCKYQEDQKDQYEVRIDQYRKRISEFLNNKNNKSIYQINNELDQINYEHIQLSKELNEFNRFVDNIQNIIKHFFLTKLKKIYDDYIQYNILPLQRIKQDYSDGIKENQFNEKYFEYLEKVSASQCFTQDSLGMPGIPGQAFVSVDAFNQKMATLSKIEIQIFDIFSDLTDYRKNIFNEEIAKEKKINPQVLRIDFPLIRDYCLLLKMKIEPNIAFIEGIKKNQQAALFTEVAANELPKLKKQLDSVSTLLDLLQDAKEGNNKIKEFASAFKREEKILKSNKMGEVFVYTINALLCNGNILLPNIDDSISNQNK